MTVEDRFLTFIPQLRQWAIAHERIKRLWVYGSRLRGTQRGDSDLDVAIEIEPPLQDDENDVFDKVTRQRWQSDIQQLFGGVVVQLQWYGGESTPRLLHFIACCSMLVYERGTTSPISNVVSRA